MMKSYLFIFLLLLSGFSLLAQAPTISSLVVTGSNIKWYDSPTGGTQYTSPETTNLVNGQIYYASQIVNGAESLDRLAVTATVGLSPTPTFTAQPGATAYKGIAVTYATQSGKTNYVWTFTGVLSTDYAISSGGTSTDNSVTLRWKTNGSKTVTINYAEDNGCTAAAATASTPTTVSTLIGGETFQGGKVVSVTYSSGETHGLIAALADQSTGIEWITGGSTQTTLNGNTSTAMGTGQANTNFMKAQSGYTGGAAKVCDDYINTETGTGIFSDWYLPSLDELDLFCDLKSFIGGFTTDGLYWSSSENISSEGKRVTFNSFCYPGWNPKSTLCRVRAIRSF